MPAPQELLSLVERFMRNQEDYHKGRFNETQLRIDYLNPVFKLLGWDMDNSAGLPERIREVIHEDQLKTGEGTKAPDYSFRIGDERKFFLEAKKPAVKIKEDTAPAFQLRSYAWTAKMPLSILSDFEEFAVYDCRIKPDRLDRASVARIEYFTFDQLPDKWDWLAGIFSKEALLQGSFDVFSEKVKSKRGMADVDDAFLAEIEEWRAWLAKDIAKRNRDISQRELNDVVQRTIDRIVFLRIAEDRGIEEYGRLLSLRNTVGVYPQLVQLFYQADARYNSGIFHFRHESGEGEYPDELSPYVVIGDDVLKNIFRRLYFPDSPYRFAVLPASILGQVYEQFLGKVITLDSKHSACVEEKPEVRKSGGVYYTPEFIAAAVVRRTVGRILEGKAPKDVAKLCFLDPACGSGSFLLVAFAYLLDWHLQWYLDNEPEKIAAQKERILNKVVVRVESADGLMREDVAWRLTTAEKRRILLNNIFGVDIDRQAVEVTKLSLLLKVLEGESRESLNKQMALFHERALPDLGNNIKCGNSLIGSDFYDDPGLLDLEVDVQRRINAMDWDREFPRIMRSGGFDVVFGNPPYVRIQSMKEWAPLEVEYYKRKYVVAGKGGYDIYVVFVEKALELLNANGVVGYILPHKFFNAKYGEPLRAIIAEGGHLSEVVHFGHQQIFEGATTYACLLFLSKRRRDSFTFAKVDDLSAWRSLGVSENGVVPAGALTSAEWSFAVGRDSELFDRLRSSPFVLGGVADIFVGLQTSADDVFILAFQEKRGDRFLMRSKSLGETLPFECDLLHPIVSGTDVVRYCPLPRRQFVLFPYSVQDERAELLPMSEIQRLFPLTSAYLRRNSAVLSARERGKFDDEKWYRFGRNQNLGIQGRAKLCVPRLVDYLRASIDLDGECFLDNVDVGGVTLKRDYEGLGLLYILALLNSRLLRWYFPKISAPFRGGWYSANRQFLSQLPVRVLDLGVLADKTSHAAIVALVEQMLALQKQYSQTKSSHDRSFLQTRIDQVDRQLDMLVYQLYGLTESEIAIVEGTDTKE